MLLYLVRLTHKKSGKVIYKRGKSKYGKNRVITERFRKSPAYDMFDIDLIASGSLSRNTFKEANLIVNTTEQVLNGLWEPKKPDFNVEQYLEEEAGSLDGCGVTEFIFLEDGETEETIVRHFNAAIKYWWKVE